MLVLEKLPLLETLDLRNCLPNTGPVDNVSHVVQFPRLQSLRLLARAMTCLKFLERARFSRHVKVSFYVYSQATSDSKELFSTLRHLLCGPHAEGECSTLLRSLSITTVYVGNALRLKAWPTYYGVQQLYDKPANNLPKPSFELTLEGISRVSALLDMLQSLPTGDIESALFDLSFRPQQTERSAWTRAFEALPKLRELGFGGRSKEYICQVLIHCVQPNEAPPSGTGGGKKTQSRSNTANGGGRDLQKLRGT